MISFEEQYYEAPSFWEGAMLQDELNQERVKQTAASIPSDVKTLLDVGCGNGIFLNYLNEARPDLELRGVDRSHTALTHVKVKKSQASITDLPFEDNSFDAVTCLEVLEHIPVPDYKKAISELARISKKYLIISVPYAEVLSHAFNTCPSCESQFNRDLHLRSYSKETMETLFDSHNIKCQSTTTLGKMKEPMGYRRYRKMFYPEQFNRWESPICPICGYAETKAPKSADESTETQRQPKKRRLISYIAAFPKQIWPSVTKYYWVMSVYSKGSQQ